MSWRRKTILSYDDLDSRREMVRLLGHRGMTDVSRLSFVRWCCSRSTSGAGDVRVEPAYRNGGYGVNEALSDVFALSVQCGGDVDVFLAELVRRVRRF